MEKVLDWRSGYRRNEEKKNLEIAEREKVSTRILCLKRYDSEKH